MDAVYFLVAITGGLWLSLVRVFGEEEAPRLRLGSRLSAPRPVAMGRLLDRLGELRKRFTQTTPHAIHDVLGATRLTSLWIRFSFACVARHRSTSSARLLAQSDKRESYVVRRIGNQTIFSEALEIFLDRKK